MRAFLGFAASVSAIHIRRREDPLPFDCYVDNGGDYVGLKTSAKSGRACENWTKSPLSSGKNLGNHNYCRNPDGSMEAPWCYVVDKQEKEACEVPKCKESTLKPEKWVAENKGEGAEPCKHVPPKRVGYKALLKHPNKACHKGYGDKQWLVGLKLEKADTLEACTELCQEKAGAEFMTYFGKADKDGGNCGCYRDACIQDAGPGEDAAVSTLNSPASYKLGSFAPVA